MTTRTKLLERIYSPLVPNSRSHVHVFFFLSNSLAVFQLYHGAATHVCVSVASGAIVVLAPLSRADFQYLSRLETVLQSFIEPVGRFSHKE